MGGSISTARIRGGGCFPDSGRLELGVFGLEECAMKVHLDMPEKCTAFFEFDTANDGGVPGHGWCGCGKAGGDECKGADAGSAATNSIYELSYHPSQWGFYFLLLGSIALVLYGVVGVVLGQRQGRDAGGKGIIAVHPHYTHWAAFVGLVQDGSAFTKAKIDRRHKGGSEAGRSNYAVVPDVETSLTSEGSEVDDGLVE